VWGVVGEPFFRLGDNLDDFDIGDILARYERDTLEELDGFCFDLFFGSIVKFGWTCHMEFFDTVWLEHFSAEWACTPREVPKASAYGAWRVKCDLRCSVL